MLLSEMEYSIRRSYLIKLILSNVKVLSNTSFNKGLDIGCSNGKFMKKLGEELKIPFTGIDPKSVDENIVKAFSYDIPFADDKFSIITLISVFEHINPEKRILSCEEIFRVTENDGILFVQLNNPYFPIEFHTGLPLFGFFPRKSQLRFASLFKNVQQIDFWSVNINKSLKCFTDVGFTIKKIGKIRYPKRTIPKKYRFFYPITKFIPMGGYAIFIKQ